MWNPKSKASGGIELKINPGIVLGLNYLQPKYYTLKYSNLFTPQAF